MMALGKKELVLLLLITGNFVVSFRRGFLFLLMLRIGCVVLLWHSYGFPFNYYAYMSQFDVNTMCNRYLLRQSYEPHHE